MERRDEYIKSLEDEIKELEASLKRMVNNV